MKKIIFILVFVVCTLATFGCDICGCAGSANYLGIVPLVQKNMVGYRFQYSSFTHPKTDLNTNNGSIVQRDLYYQNNLWMRFFLTPKWQLFANLPYKINQRVESERTTTLSGLGDASVITNYTIYQTDNDTAMWKHRLLGGAHLGLPLGKYQQRDETKKTLPIYFQLGTGAWSYGLNINYTVRYKKLGANATGRYTINTVNEQDYKLGNQFQASAVLFYWWDVKKSTILPQAGLVYDAMEQDLKYDVIEETTGATRLSAVIGADVYLGEFLLNASLQIPFVEDLPYAQPSQNPQISFSVAYFFEK